MKTVVVAQARTGSARLPGKVLMRLGNQTVIEHVLTRARMAKNADAVCIATTLATVDDPICDAAERLNIPVFRGSESDVLGRYAGAARMTEADVVVRITGDCPLIDPAVIDRVVALRAEHGADYACNGLALDWPHGLDCEVFTREMLEAAAASTVDPYDREHVTPWIRNHGARTRLHLPGPGQPAADQRWVIDYPEDYEFLVRLFGFFPDGKPPPAWEDVWAISRKHPEIDSINEHLRRTELPK